MKKLILTILGIVMFCFCKSATANDKYTPPYLGKERSCIGHIYATIVSPISASSIQNFNTGIINTAKDTKVKIDEYGRRYSNKQNLTNSRYSQGIIKINGPSSHFISVSIPEVKLIGEINKSVNFTPTITNNGKATSLNNGESKFMIGGIVDIKNTAPKGGHSGYYVVQASY